jgi:translin
VRKSTIMQLNDIFKSLKSDLDNLDEKREYLLPITRDIVRLCSEIIKSVHRNELDYIEEQIKQIKRLISTTQEKAFDTLQGMGKNYMSIVNQEFTEAVTFYSLIKNGTLPHYKEIGVNSYEYLLGLSDLIGELKRMILNKIRNDDIDTAERLYEHMENIHEHLFGLDYPSGLLPGFRKKVDNTRGILISTLELIVSSKQINNLKTTLEQTTKN